jgi:RNA polymerase sigma factor (sigma-70 family)
MELDKSFQVTMQKYEQRIYRAIAQYVSDACSIEDLTQITFMKAWIYRETFRGQSSYSTWLYRIAINSALNFLSANKIRPRRSCYDDGILEKIPSAYNTEKTAITNQEMTILYAYINSLEENLRVPLIMHVIYGLSLEDTSCVLDVPVGTIKSRVHRARFLLKQKFAREHER